MIFVVRSLVLIVLVAAGVIDALIVVGGSDRARAGGRCRTRTSCTVPTRRTNLFRRTVRFAAGSDGRWGIPSEPPIRTRRDVEGRHADDRR